MRSILYHAFCLIVIVAEHLKHPRHLVETDCSHRSLRRASCGSRVSVWCGSRERLYVIPQSGRLSGRPGAPKDERRTIPAAARRHRLSLMRSNFPPKPSILAILVDTGTEPARATIVPTNGLSSSLAIWRHQTQPASTLKPSPTQPRARYGGQRIRGRERVFDQQAQARIWLTVRVVKHGDILVRLRGGTG